MKAFFAALSFFILTTTSITYAQKFVDKEKLFTDTTTINATLTFNMKSLLSRKLQVGVTIPATFSCKSGDTIDVNDHILLEVRGHLRRTYCDMPPLKLIYKRNASNAFYPLKMLKLVNACKPGNDYDQYLLKEYLCYKIYNLLTDMSLRPRLLNLKYQDSSGKKKPVTRCAFLLEEPKEMAKRNKCRQFGGRIIQNQLIDRTQETLLSLFEYFIGNTDWGISFHHNVILHNIILLQSKKDSLAAPFPVAYDFDGSGMVNADYVAPDQKLGISSVRERAYKGLPKTMAELNTALDVFKKQKAAIYATVDQFDLLTYDTKREMKSYLDDFYDTIDDPAKVRETFITNARKSLAPPGVKL